MKKLFYDIETAPAIGLFFGKPYDVNIAKTIQHEYVFGFAWKWEGDKKIHTCYIWDYPEYSKKLKPRDQTLAAFLEALDERIRACSRKVLTQWAVLANEANILVGHNSDQFDYKQMHGRLIQYDLPPIAKPQFVDTKKAAKQLGYYSSNKLDDLVQRFGLGKKLPHNNYPHVIDLWWDCMNDVPKAQKHMVAYNKVDVEVTERLYQRFMPYMTNHPNAATIDNRPSACPKCGAEGTLRSSGTRVTKTARYRRYVCTNCASWISSRTADKGERIQYV